MKSYSQHRNRHRNLYFLIAFSVVLLLLTISRSLYGSVLAAPAYPPGTEDPAMSLTLSSPSFPNGGNIQKQFTCDGADLSPRLSWTDPPAGTKTFAILVDDPDAPGGNWNHWTTWNLPPTLRSLPEGLPKTAQLLDGTEQGTNDFRKPGYNGPCPPPGKPHRYYFKLFALDTKLELKPNSGKHDLETAMNGHILAQAEWMGRFGR